MCEIPTHQGKRSQIIAASCQFAEAILPPAPPPQIMQLFKKRINAKSKTKPKQKIKTNQILGFRDDNG